MNEYIQHHHNQKSAENPWQIVAFISEWTMDGVVLLYKSLEKNPANENYFTKEEESSTENSWLFLLEKTRCLEARNCFPIQSINIDDITKKKKTIKLKTKL